MIFGSLLELTLGFFVTVEQFHHFLKLSATSFLCGFHVESKEEEEKQKVVKSIRRTAADERTIRRSNDYVGRYGSWRPVIDPEFIPDENGKQDEGRWQIANHQAPWDFRKMVLEQSETGGRELSQEEEKELEEKFGLSRNQVSNKGEK